MSDARNAQREIAVEALLSVEEAARRLGGLSKYTIHAWLSSGKLRRTKVGSRTMIRESELQRVIEDGGKSPAARQSKWQDKEKKAWDAKTAFDAERDRRAACFDELVKALEWIADNFGGMAAGVARTALARAKKEGAL